MPYEGLGLRHTGVAERACVHGQIVECDGFVGTAFKVEQIGRFVDTTAVGYRPPIDIGEVFEMQLCGIHEADRDNNLAAAAVGNDVYINSANDTLGLAAQGVTAGALTAGWLPVGKITEIDAVRDVVFINANVAHLLVGP